MGLYYYCIELVTTAPSSRGYMDIITPTEYTKSFAQFDVIGLRIAYAIDGGRLRTGTALDKRHIADSLY